MNNCRFVRWGQVNERMKSENMTENDEITNLNGTGNMVLHRSNRICRNTPSCRTLLLLIFITKTDNRVAGIEKPYFAKGMENHFTEARFHYCIERESLNEMTV